MPFHIYDRTFCNPLSAINWTINGNGSVIVGHCTGKPVIDMLGSRFWTINNLTIWRDQTNKPSYCIQIGHLGVSAVGDGIFRDVNIQGRSISSSL